MFTLLQIGLAPERVEPSGWQGSEQKVTSVGLVLSLCLPSHLPTTLKSLLFFETNSGFRICMPCPHCASGWCLSPLAYYCISFLGPLKENTANFVSLLSRGEVWNHEVWRALLPWWFLASLLCLRSFWDSFFLTSTFTFPIKF